jgi:hypothetical protein
MNNQDRRDLEELRRAIQQLRAEMYEAVMPHLDKLIMVFVVSVALLLIFALWELTGA